MSNKLNPLIIDDLEIPVPIIQGGMGVKISTSSLVSAVANYGGAGTIATVGLGSKIGDTEHNYRKDSIEGLRSEIRKTRELTSGVIGVNILAALNNYEDLARVSAEENVDFIVVGAGLPLKLPEYTKCSKTKLIPIVSSARTTDLIIKSWKRRYDRLPDALLVEGPLAGGHLGFASDSIKSNEYVLEKLVIEVLETASKYEKEFGKEIPVIAAGGIFTGKDIAKFLQMGVKGVQMATRFVATKECSVSESFKELYLKSTEKDVVIIDSPVGLPGRAVNNKFIKDMAQGKKTKIRCNYRCLKTCDPLSAPYCIAQALLNAEEGNIDEAIVFCGGNVSRVKEIVSVKELMDELVSEAVAELHALA